mmetsp:Transcript_23638/g.37050  ORF Transcript_23638/g.37050 Transcript_23638/m.37050 type:complete len:328 (+) Transcript_23638:467-1450(+)
MQNQSVKHLVIIGIQKKKDQLRLKGDGNIMEIRARYNDVPTTLVSISPVRKATLAPKRRSGQYLSKLEKDIGYEPNCSYIDGSVFSECRLMEVWNFHNADDEEEEEGSEGGEYDSYVDENDDHDEMQQEQHSQEGDEYEDWHHAAERNESHEEPKRTRDVHHSTQSPNNRHESEYNNDEMDHYTGSGEGIDDDDIWDKALAKHNEEEQERFVDQFETLYTDDVISPLKMEELERTKSERVKEQSQYQAAGHKYSSRHDQSHAEEEEEGEETHDDLIAWSDDKLDWSDDDVITDLPRGRSDSISPKKSQPWHKKDAHDDSSISFEGYD